MKTLTAFITALLVVPSAFAQQAQPVEAGDLPRLRTPAPVRAPVKNDAAVKSDAPVTGKKRTRGDDIGAVEVKKCEPMTGTFTWNWDNAKILDIVNAISKYRCKNFIISKNLNATISIISRTPVNIEQAWQSFLSALDSNNLAAVQVGSYYKIVSTTEAPKKNIPVYEKGQTLPADEGMVTLVYDARNISRESATSLMSTLAKPPISAGEYLILSDTAINIKRVMKVLEKVDVPGAANRIHIVDLEYSSSKDMKAKIDEIYPSAAPANRGMMNFPRVPRVGIGGGGDSEGEGTVQKVVADDRTNKLIIIASDRMYVRIKEIIEKLDVPASGASAHSQINIFQLKNSKAKDLATTLQSLVSGVTAPKPNQPKQPQPFNPNPQSGAQAEAQFEGEIKVTADEKTNALLVSASPRDFRTLSQVIARLDKRRPQVYVEAVVMEVSAKDEQTFGIDFYSGIAGIPNIPGIGEVYGIAGNAGGQTLAGKVVGDYTKALVANPTGAGALALQNFISTLGLFGGQIPGPNGTKIPIPSIGVALRFIETVANTEILATPSLTTVDNETSTIEVGQKIPVLTGQTQLSGASANVLGGVTNNVSYLDVTNKLEITPHVNDNDEILFEIKQDINDVGEKIEFPGGITQYNILKKKTDTKVMTSDQQSVIIGGLISRNKSHTESKVPWFGDIPIIGSLLFKNQTNAIKHNNLLLVLTPYVIRSQADNLKIYERKKKEHEDFSKSYFGDKILKFDPYIDYDKKPGPIAMMLHEVGQEMKKVENGGPGLDGEIIVRADKPAELKEVKLNAVLPTIPVTGGADDGQINFPMPMPFPQQVPVENQPVQEPQQQGQPGQPQPNVPVAQPPAGEGGFPTIQNSPPPGWNEQQQPSNVQPPAGAPNPGNVIIAPQSPGVQAPPPAQ